MIRTGSVKQDKAHAFEVDKQGSISNNLEKERAARKVEGYSG